MGGGGAFAYFKLVKSRPKTKGNDNLDDYDYGEDDTDQEDEDSWETEESDEPDADGGGRRGKRGQDGLTRFTDSPYERMMTRRPEAGRKLPVPPTLSPGHPCYGCGNYRDGQPCVGFCHRQLTAWLREREDEKP